ncbi:MAG: VacB/RNase II family 3'-5' exoribonuclease, partial [Oscillospiraceae bacterium]
MSLKEKLLKDIEEEPRKVKYLRKKYGEDKKMFDKIDELVREGKLKKIDNTFYIAKNASKLATAQNKNILACTLVKLAKNFGFAKPLDGVSPDVFIPGRMLCGAMTGDEITVSLFAVPQREGSCEGEVVDITKENNRIVGTVKKMGDKLYIVPDNSNATFIQIKKGAEGGAKDGEKAAAEIIERAQNHDGHRAGVTMRFGDSNLAKECAKALLYGAGIEKSFPQKVKAAAKLLEDATVDKKEVAKRVDFRNKIIFTIDSASTKDIDDAISAEKTENGYELGVHIADVSHYVTAGSVLDNEAFKRATSVYYAESVVPMLPRQLSNGICSLNEGVDRLAFSCVMNLDKTGKVTDYKFVKSTINSTVKGVYKEINAILKGEADAEITKKYAKVNDSIAVMKEIFDLLAIRRTARGSMDIESGEAKILVDENGVCIGIEKRESGVSENMIEEFMLLANGCAANLARRREVPFVYRIHEKPELQRVENLKNSLLALGITAEFEEEVPNQIELSKLLDDARGTNIERPVHINVLRTMSKAKYSKEPKGHYGLVLEDYSHFTSPIRRYPDLAIHRILTDIVAGMGKEELIAKYDAFAQSASEQSSKQEITAMQTERSCEDCYKA